MNSTSLLKMYLLFRLLRNLRHYIFLLLLVIEVSIERKNTTSIRNFALNHHAKAWPRTMMIMMKKALFLYFLHTYPLVLMLLLLLILRTTSRHPEQNLPSQIDCITRHQWWYHTESDAARKIQRLLLDQRVVLTGIIIKHVLKTGDVMKEHTG